MLVTCATDNYWPLLQPLLISHHHTNPENTLHVHAIDWPDALRQSAEAKYPHARFYACQAPEGNAPMEQLGPVPRSAAILKLKVKLLKAHYEETTEPVIWVDADTLLLKPIDALLERVKAAGDFAVTYRKSKRAHAKFAVAVLCFTRTEAAERLLAQYATSTLESDGLVKKSSADGVAWFHDQLALWQCYTNQSRWWFGLPKPNGARLVALTENEHAIDGETDAVFVSRRDGVFDLEQMQTVLKELGFTEP